MGILRDRMTEEMKLRNFSPATQKSYLYAVTRLAKYYRRPPDQLDKEQIRSYLLHLAVERKLSPNTMTGQISGLRFFYNETLAWDETKLFIPPRKKSSSLPEVFSPRPLCRTIANPSATLRARPPFYNLHSRNCTAAPRFSPTRFIPLSLLPESFRNLIASRL
jgi:site-specific recombinase XerD